MILKNKTLATILSRSLETGIKLSVSHGDVLIRLPPSHYTFLVLDIPNDITDDQLSRLVQLSFNNVKTDRQLIVKRDDSGKPTAHYTWVYWNQVVDMFNCKDGDFNE